MKLRHVVAGVVLAVGVIAAAGSGGTTVSNSTVTTAAAGGSTATTAAGSGGTTATTSGVAHTGATIAVSGNSSKANVTLNQVIDPASGADSLTTPDNGKRFVGVKMTIVNTGTSTLSDDANITVSVVGSDNQSYTADFNSISECTNFNSGSYSLAAAESVTGCTTFQLPTGVTVARVKYEPTSFGGTSGEWLNP